MDEQEAAIMIDFMNSRLVSFNNADTYWLEVLYHSYDYDISNFASTIALLTDLSIRWAIVYCNNLMHV